MKISVIILVPVSCTNLFYVSRILSFFRSGSGSRAIFIYEAIYEARITDVSSIKYICFWWSLSVLEVPFQLLCHLPPLTPDETWLTLKTFVLRKAKSILGSISTFCLCFGIFLFKSIWSLAGFIRWGNHWKINEKRTGNVLLNNFRVKCCVGLSKTLTQNIF